MMQTRDGTGPAYKELATRRYAAGQDLTLHRHGAAGDPGALMHEHVLGRGMHRHDGPGRVAAGSDSARARKASAEGAR